MRVLSNLSLFCFKSFFLLKIELTGYISHISFSHCLQIWFDIANFSPGFPYKNFHFLKISSLPLKGRRVISPKIFSPNFSLFVLLNRLFARSQSPDMAVSRSKCRRVAVAGGEALAPFKVQHESEFFECQLHRRAVNLFRSVLPSSPQFTWLCPAWPRNRLFSAS